MRISYDEKADALYIRLKETPYYESDEVREGVCWTTSVNCNPILCHVSPPILALHHSTGNFRFVKYALASTTPGIPMSCSRLPGVSPP